MVAWTDVCICVCVCGVMCVCLGAAGGRTTWHPDVEQDVLLKTRLLFPTNCTDFAKRADAAVAFQYYCTVAKGR